MVVPEVDQKLLEELEGMGFPKARATRALHYSGNVGLEDAVNWAVEHENDADIDQMLKVPLNTKTEASKPSITPEETKMKAQELKEQARKKKEEKEKRREREANGKREGEENADTLVNYVLLHTFRNMVLFRSKMERIRVGEELLDAKRIEEENERKCVVASRKAEKEEEKRAREKIRQKLEEDKAERRRKLGLPPEDPVAAKPSAPAVEEKKDNEAKVKMAFNTLLTYARNVATNTNEEKFRKIRLSNATFQARVGALKGGIKFLELCGFKKIDGGEFLFLPRDKVDMAVLNSAGTELNSAINNPFFGVL
ncbi:UBX domain-containing protein 1-like isoform X4 [Camellia sinensis]|uniref:UBX domain-containing protein 1-like isoform X4 n=1 Tax=Camellia sinensis TaxID=4442 RepID=UPI0010360FB3|nr:UBX domain-containing protein 1-like isoform X4 [Camellia sinensis]